MATAMTKEEARMAIRGAAHHILLSWDFFLHVREKQDALYSEKVDEVDAAVHRQQVDQVLRELEADARNRITACADVIRGLEGAMKFLDDE